MSPEFPVRIARTHPIVPPLRRMAAACLAVLALASGPSLAQSALPGRNVESFLEIAREKNPEFAAMRLEAAAARERPESAGALPDPTVRVELMDITNAGTEAGPSLLPSRIGGTKYTVMQMLPWFGKRDAMREAAEADAQAASSRVDVTWLELAMRIKSAYAQYYVAAENEKLTRGVLDLMAQLESVAQSRYAGGLAAQQDAIRAQVEQTSMRTDLVVLESERRRAAARLNALVARPGSAPIADPERIRPLPPPARLQIADLEERARARNPVIAVEEARARSAGKMVELADLNRYPDLTVGLSPTQTRNRISEWEIMFEVSIPLQQGSRRAKEREARAMLDAARAKRDAASTSSLGELSESLAGLEAARKTEALAATSLLPQAELTFQSALAAYENGKVDFATLLDAQRQILRAKQERLKAQAEAQMRLAEIERIVGEDL
ncbi:MAG TPA: TolC family protein [Usitatibacteraceae bacterium]|nr:TolC family protein [Usitatibacteraceae bacterium]